MIRTTAATLLALLALSACSGGDSAPDSPKALADTLGCSSTYAADSTEEIGVEAVGTCEVDGYDVRLLTFANDEARDNFVQVAEGFGGRYVTGPGYAVEAEGAAAEKAVREAVEG